MAENENRVVQIRGAADLDAVEQNGRLGLLLSLEGVEPFGYELWPLDAFWELGVRMASLTWNRRNPYAGGAADDAGLSRLGRALVDRLCERGVILDLAHASTALFDEVLARSGDAPLLVSHAGCRTVHDHPRNVDDDRLRALAERGGLLGLMLHPLAIDPGRRTIARVIDHLDTRSRPSVSPTSPSVGTSSRGSAASCRRPPRLRTTWRPPISGPGSAIQCPRARSTIPL